MNGNGNGNSKMIWWIVATLTTIVAGMVSGWVTSSQNHAARIAVLESEQREIKSHLEKISDKLDTVILNQRKGQ